MPGMSLGMSLRQTQVVAQSLALTHSQQIVVRNQVLQVRLELVQALRDERYVPKAECPKCYRSMTPVEIIDGFNDDPNDFTTCCSGCSYRFEPVLVCFGNGTVIEMPFFCATQVLPQMHGLEVLPPEEIARLHPSVYRSAIVHHGGIRRAFELIGVEYKFEEIADWTSKVRPFLGRLPDTVIAECVDVGVSVIRRMRRKLGLPRYTVRVSLEEAVVES